MPDSLRDEELSLGQRVKKAVSAKEIGNKSKHDADAREKGVLPASIHAGDLRSARIFHNLRKPCEAGRASYANLGRPMQFVHAEEDQHANDGQIMLATLLADLQCDTSDGPHEHVFRGMQMHDTPASEFFKTISKARSGVPSVPRRKPRDAIPILMSSESMNYMYIHGVHVGKNVGHKM